MCIYIYTHKPHPLCLKWGQNGGVWANSYEGCELALKFGFKVANSLDLNKQNILKRACSKSSKTSLSNNNNNNNALAPDNKFASTILKHRAQGGVSTNSLSLSICLERFFCSSSSSSWLSSSLNHKCFKFFPLSLLSLSFLLVRHLHLLYLLHGLSSCSSSSSLCFVSEGRQNDRK